METKEIQSFIKKQRKLHGMTQADLARRAGVGLRFIRELEQGKPTLKMDKVNQVLQLFGKTLGPVDWRHE
jgi:y4mF family transcriptional regulator